MKTYSFEDGKYEIDRDDSPARAITAVRRNGEFWPACFDDFVFKKIIYAMLNKLDDLEKQNKPSCLESGKYANVLIPFFALMETELRANSAKGDRPDWLQMSPEIALLEIYWHTAKLSAAVKNQDVPRIREHSADVANMAMMLADICGGLIAGEENAKTP